MTNMTDEATEHNKDNFVRDASLAEISHPNIIGVVDVVKSKSSLYLIMDYANGGTLDGLINRRRSDMLRPDEVHYLVV